MSLVAHARGLSAWGKDRLIPQRVVFHHVPKCGGTSVGRALRGRYILSQGTVTPEESFRAFEAFTGRADREQMLIDVLDLREQMMLYLMFKDVRCISLHVRFSNVAHDIFSRKYKFVTILREPISRFVSHYFWSYGKPHAHARIEEGIEAFLATDRAKRLGATYVEYFGGLPKHADIRSSHAIQAAIENLRRMDVVGRLDDLPSFEEGLREHLGVRIRVGHENKMKQPSRKRDVLKPQLVEQVRGLCAPDLAIWEALFGAAQA